MKKINISLFAVFALLANGILKPKSHMLHDFEKMKTVVARDIKEEAKDISTEWDDIITKIESTLKHAKTAKIAHTSLLQHAKTAETTKESLVKEKSNLTGKDKKVVKEYAAIADRSEGHADSQRQKTSHLVDKLEQHMEKTVKDAKQDHAQTIAAHNDVQQVLSDHDKHMNDAQ